MTPYPIDLLDSDEFDPTAQIVLPERKKKDKEDKEDKDKKEHASNGRRHRRHRSRRHRSQPVTAPQPAQSQAAATEASKEKFERLSAAVTVLAQQAVK